MELGTTPAVELIFEAQAALPSLLGHLHLPPPPYTADAQGLYTRRARQAVVCFLAVVAPRLTDPTPARTALADQLRGIMHTIEQGLRSSGHGWHSALEHQLLVLGPALVRALVAQQASAGPAAEPDPGPFLAPPVAAIELGPPVRADLVWLLRRRPGVRAELLLLRTDYHPAGWRLGPGDPGDLYPAPEERAILLHCAPTEDSDAGLRQTGTTIAARCEALFTEYRDPADQDQLRRLLGALHTLLDTPLRTLGQGAPGVRYHLSGPVEFPARLGFAAYDLIRAAVCDWQLFGKFTDTGARGLAPKGAPVSVGGRAGTRYQERQMTTSTEKMFPLVHDLFDDLTRGAVTGAEARGLLINLFCAVQGWAEGQGEEESARLLGEVRGMFNGAAHPLGELGWPKDHVDAQGYDAAAWEKYGFETPPPMDRPVVIPHSFGKLGADDLRAILSVSWHHGKVLETQARRLFFLSEEMPALVWIRQIPAHPAPAGLATPRYRVRIHPDALAAAQRRLSWLNAQASRSAEPEPE
jgi:hypothetical protein